jgi:hypothetical protein
VTRKSIEVEVIGGIHATPSVQEQPDIALQRWWVLEVSGYLGQRDRRTRHFVGWNVFDVEGRASTPIVAWDPVTRRGRTESGRVYELRGDPGYQADADYVWKGWSRANRVMDEKDVTAEYVPKKKLTLDDVREEMQGGENTGPGSR